MFRSSFFLLLVLAAPGLAGCGQSGPLYLPGNPSKITTTPPGQAQAPEATSTRENDENRDSEKE